MVEIRASVASKTAYASHQNAVPILSELVIASDPDDEVLEDLTIEVEADPPFVEPRTWRVDRLAPGSTLHITDRDVSLKAGLLSRLTEGLRGTLTLRVKHAGETLARSDHHVELLGRSEWGGAASMAELLAAFVMPNDPAVDVVLKAASDVLRRAGKRDAIDGYEGGSRTRVWELTSAVWSAVAGLRIAYALPPASFEERGQKVRTPGAVLAGRLATCLDTALLFAAAIEQAGLNPLVVMTKGHALAGVWLQPQEFASLVTDDAGTVRKRVDLKELAVFETTLATHLPTPGFRAAADAGRRHIGEENDDSFVMALDVRRARMRRIRPLADPGEGISAPGGPTAPVAEALEEAPALPGFDVEVETAPTTAATRIALWQRRLLDLTTRNKLLSMPDTAKGVRLLCTDVGALEDRLATGGRIKVVAMPDLGEGGRDGAIHRLRTTEVLEDEYVRSALGRGEVLSPLEPKRLDAALVELWRKARLDMEEGGANTLFLALGFLRWRKAEEDPRTYRAPLILLPVRLERRSAVSGVVMARHDDEARFNLTLLEMLRQDFQLRIPGLEGPLPVDGSGVDVAAVWNAVRREVRDIRHFEVVEDIALSTFSFAKYLMWKDLADRADQLKGSPVVRHLIERAAERFPGGGDFPSPERLDEIVEPGGLFTPLPADSSQLAAVLASARGCDFVLDGPPGTGKSQTIANMIAHNLALGRRVLFVAEKRAALDVVHRRLAEKGLGEFCLELHSNKTTKAKVVETLGRAWDARDAMTADEWAREAADVQRLRDRLNEVVRLLHRRHPNGLTLHRAIGRSVRDWSASTPVVAWHGAALHDEAAYAGLRDLARRLDLNWGALREVPHGALDAVERREWSNGWQEGVVASARETFAAAVALNDARGALLEAGRLPDTGSALEDLDALRRLVEAIVGCRGSDLRFAFAPDAPERIAAARRAAALVERHRAAEMELSVRFGPETFPRLDLAGFDADWRNAGKRIWGLRRLARRGVARRLQAEGAASGRPDPSRDLPVLAEMASLRSALDALSAGLSGVPHAAGLASDAVRLAGVAEAADRLRSSMAAAAHDPEALVAVRGAVALLVVEANDLLGREGRLAQLLARYVDRLDALVAAVAGLDRLMEGAPAPGRSLGAVCGLAEALVARAPQLKAWCDWRRVGREAADAGLGAVAAAVESGAIPAGQAADVFETAYSRWFAARTIDAEPRLRDLVTVEHADDIETFRRLDDRLSALSVRYIRARICGGLPDRSAVGRKDGFGVLKHEMQKQRAHKPIRQLAGEMGEAFARLAPCMLMSPLSIAQYLPAEQALFDLVIFDEASQIAPWDAVGSIARGRQVVVAGDPRQMPPTNFFSRGVASVDDDLEPDMDSILDECLAAGVPRHGLEWHYRSRHESLIAFSNHRYYDGKLITFPAPVTRDAAVSWRRTSGIYAKGRGRTNQVEAEAIVAEVVGRLEDAVASGGPASVAVVTLNAEQQGLVENLLDARRRERPELERFFGDGVLEPVVVKNLETVQGDERDVVMIGVGYGPTEPGARAMSMNFGPLNRDGGWRRLNVAITRARREMMVFTSFDPSMIDLNRTSAGAVRDLKHFLEFADRGPSALAEAVQGSVGGYESPLEEAVASALVAKGWVVAPQIGVSRFRIDLGVVHPDRPGDYLAGVECDGAAYHSGATARDRDKVRASILEGLGWDLVRVWSTDWWVDRRGATERLHGALGLLLERSRSAAAAPASSGGRSLDGGADDAPDEIESASPEALPVPPAGVLSRSGAAPVATLREAYRRADLACHLAAIDPERFYEPEYGAVLAVLVATVLEIEAPILLDTLVTRVARVHGFTRSGRTIRERVADAAVHHHVASDEEGLEFVWLSVDQQRNWRSFRVPPDEMSSRSPEEVCLEELRAAALKSQAGDVAADVAKTFGAKRAGAAARRRVELALARS